MRDVCSLIWLTLIGLFRSRASLQAEILTLRHQLNLLQRKSPQRLTFTKVDRLVFAGLYRLAPGVLEALKIVRPETVIRWHRAGFRAYWRWKSKVPSRYAGVTISAASKDIAHSSVSRDNPSAAHYFRMLALLWQIYSRRCFSPICLLQ